MRRLAVVAVAAFSLVAVADIALKSQGVSKGNVTTLNFVGSRVSADRAGSVGTVTILACGTCDGGTLADGGCGHCYPAPIDSCAALDSGDWVGSGKWCLKGDQTMATGSAIALYGVNSIPAPESWPLLPDGTLQSMTRLNDISGGSANWNQYFTSDGGQEAPTGSFTTWTVASNMIRDVSQLTNLTNAFVRFGASGAIKWADVSGSLANGDNVICKNGASNSCAGPNNLTSVPRRAMGIHFAVFSAGDGGTGSGSTSSCTCVPGAGTTCVSTAHIYPRIGTAGSPSSWYVGLSQSGTGSAEMGDYWHAGSGMTEKAFTLADMNRLCALILPSTQAGETFVRVTDKTCCTSSNQCVNLPPNVPCSTNCAAEASPYQVLNTDATPEDTMSLTGVGAPLDGGSAIPIAVTEDHAGPFGFRTAIKYTFHQTEVLSSDGGTPYSWSESRALSCSGLYANGTLRCSWYILGVTGSEVLDACVVNTAPTLTQPYGQQCTTFTPSASTWGLYSITARDVLGTASCQIGNLTQTAPSNSQPNNGTGLTTGVHVVRPLQSVWITADQCNPISNEPDYSFLGNSTMRAPETCTGVGCP